MNTELFEVYETECAMLSLLVFGFEAHGAVLSRLTETDFASIPHREIFRAIQRRALEKQPIDLPTIADDLPDLTSYLLDKITKTFWTATQADYYVAELKKAARRRSLYMYGKNVMESAGERDIDAVIDEARIKLKQFAPLDDTEESMQDVILRVHDDLYADKDQEHLKLGIPALDKELIGFQPGNLYVIGARPCVGKSVFGMIAALRAGEHGKRPLIINREMKKEQIVMRMLANLSGIDIGRIRRKQLTDEEKAQLITTYAQLDNMNIEIYNKPQTPAQIREAALRLYEKDGLDLLVVDYLQRITSGRKTGNRDEEVGAICWAIKNIAMDLNIPVVLLSQLNRSAVNTRPRSSNLRESGNIEQDADVVILLHTPDYDDVPDNRKTQYDHCQKNDGDYLEMIIDKNREGQNRIIPVMFHGATMRFMPL